MFPFTCLQQPVLTVSVCVFGMGSSIRREAQALIHPAEHDCKSITPTPIIDHSLTQVGIVCQLGHVFAGNTYWNVSRR